MAEEDVMSTADVASQLDVSESRARAYAKANGLPRIGMGFAWTAHDVAGLADQLADEEQEEEEDEEDQSEHVHVEGDLDFEPADDEDEEEDYDDEEEYED